MKMRKKVVETRLMHNSEKYHKNEVRTSSEPFIFESGRFAKQALASVWARWGDSIVLVTVCSGEAREGADFFPLTCEYIEKTYAAGRIPGGFLKREARPKDDEILISRLIDRSIRPMFPDGYFNELQIVATVVSYDGIHDTGILALNAASMALHMSPLPYSLENGPVAAVRVARVNGQLVANPTLPQMLISDLDLKVSSTKNGIVMVEGGADEMPEEELLDALFFAQQEGLKIVEACEDMRANLGKEKQIFTQPSIDEDFYALVKADCHKYGLDKALSTKSKKQRYELLSQIQKDVIASISETLSEEQKLAGYDKKISSYFADIKKNHMRKEVLDNKTRIDGRGYADIRPICCEVGVLPRAHGSAIFTRGETQGLVSVTLGTSEDEQRIDALGGEFYRRFTLHYNFPPFSTGEARPLRGTSRREIGHGALAERALSSVVPQDDAEFPYSLRIVSEIIECNGSSSMASVCGGTLALFDAGIKLKAPVAGIAMGMIKEGKKYAVLSDILGDEDHLGDMDFKVCGSENGITAIQMDIKVDGLSKEILHDALIQAKEGRVFILSEMKKALPAPREEVSDNAPRIHKLRVNPDKIRDIIGPGGRTIRDIVARSGAKVEVSDDGIVQIAGMGKFTVETAVKIIEDLTKEAELNKVYKGLVKRVLDFGAFIEIFPGAEGLCHISELSEKRVDNVTDILQEGDEVNVAVLNVDREGKVRLSRKKAIGKKPGETII